jgi:signal transduction histidine kinase
MFGVPWEMDAGGRTVIGLACALGRPWAERQQRRSHGIAALGLESFESIPAWEEATQLVAQGLAAPIAVITLVDSQWEYFRAAYGLSHLGVGNPLSQQRQIPYESGLGLYVVSCEQPVVFSDTTASGVTGESELVATYGLQAYAGVPLVTSQGLCIGTLAVMDTQPRSFSSQDLIFLAMAARWGMSEYERQSASLGLMAAANAQLSLSSLGALTDAARLNLLSQMTQDLRSPLTTVLGMTSMLNREIYGPLTAKQREYTDIVQRSSQTLMTLVDEIIDLTAKDATSCQLVPTTVDIAALGQQVITGLTQVAEASSQTLHLTVEPGENHWILDQHTVKQIFYHLLFSILQVSGENSTLCVHACRRGQDLALVVWLANPWLEEGLPSEVLEVYRPAVEEVNARRSHLDGSTPKPFLGLLLSQRLAEHHGGYIKVQGSADSGCRLVVTLPALDTTATSRGAAALTAPDDIQPLTFSKFT